MGFIGTEKVLFFATVGALYLLSGLFFWSVLARLLSSALKRLKTGETWLSICWRYVFGRLWLLTLPLVFLLFVGASLWLSDPEVSWNPSLLVALLLSLLFSLGGAVIVTLVAYLVGKDAPERVPRELARGLGIPWAMFGAVIFVGGLVEALEFWMR